MKTFFSFRAPTTLETVLELIPLKSCQAHSLWLLASSSRMPFINQHLWASLRPQEHLLRVETQHHEASSMSGHRPKIFWFQDFLHHVSFPKAIKTMVPLWCPVVIYSSYLPSLVMNQISCLCSLPSSSVFPTGPRLGSQAWLDEAQVFPPLLLISQRSSQQLETTGFNFKIKETKQRR